MAATTPTPSGFVRMTEWADRRPGRRHTALRTTPPVADAIRRLRSQ